MGKLSICYDVTDDILAQMIRLDESVYHLGDIGNFDLCKNWLSKNNEIYTVLMQDDKVVGYLNFMPLVKSSYDQYRAGRLRDYQITSFDIESYADNTEYYGLICSIVLDSSLRKSTATLRLFKGFLDKLNQLKSRGITFKSVLCECVTDDGIANAKKLGLSLVNPAHEIYEGALNI